MKLDKNCLFRVASIGLFLALLGTALGADMSPNVESPKQKTPPEIGVSDVGGIKVPPAIPLDKLTEPSKAPVVGAKKAPETAPPPKKAEQKCGSC